MGKLTFMINDLFLSPISALFLIFRIFGPQGIEALPSDSLTLNWLQLEQLERRHADGRMEDRQKLMTKNMHSQN